MGIPFFRVAFLALALSTAAGAWANEPSVVFQQRSLWLAQNEEAAKPARTEPGLTVPKEIRNRDYALPALEILGFDFLLNRFNHAFSGSRDYDVSGASIRRNLRSS